jgi:bifunctional polynucleotide phosphatase/kinase
MLKRYVSINQSVFVIDRRILAKGEPGSTKIRAFDLDSTLIQTRSGKVFPIDADDYQWGIGVLIQLKKLHDDGYTIVIFSNQSGISDSSNEKLGSNKTFECQKCKIVIDRDCNGCRNILLKAF